jgi:lysophospholipase L1-like esterase
MGKYKTFGSRFDRVHRNDLNANFAAVEADINAQKSRVDGLIQGTPQPSEVVDARGGFPVLSGRLNDLSTSLAQIVNFNKFYINPKNGKKIIMVGDSTTDIAPAMYTRFGVHTGTGGLLEGATVTNHGLSGNTLYNFVNNLSTKTINEAIAYQGDLYVISYGINDIKQGTYTKAQIIANLKIAIDRILNETNAIILLRTPNMFLTINQNEWVQPIENAQIYSDQLYEIYESLRGYHSKVDVIDMQSRIFGRKSIPTHPLMKDTIHPNDAGYIAIADEIAEHITNSRKQINPKEQLVLKGVITASTASTITIVASSVGNIAVGDTIYVGTKSSFIAQTVSADSKGITWTVGFNGQDITKLGSVLVVRNASKSGLIVKYGGASTKPITDYEIDSITSEFIVASNPDIANFPEGLKGRLDTKRTGISDLYSTQHYYLIDSDKIYYRRWTAGGWSVWTKVYPVDKNLTILATNSVTTATALTSFPTDSVSACAIASSNTDIANFPEAIRGTLLTYRLSTGDTFSYQEYSIYQTGKVYKRWWNTTGWTAWVKITAV